MKKRIINEKLLKGYKTHLENEEKSEATVEKYMRDVCVFSDYVLDNEVTKQTVIDYKHQLSERYSITSANSMLAALNSFFRFCGWNELCVKRFKSQRQTYCAKEKELTKKEYIRLLEAAKRSENERIYLIIQTICSSGIRVSELKYVTVEAVSRGEATVRCKGKTRRIFIIPKLRKKLLSYIKSREIKKGPVFVTRSGRPMNRSNIWREMKGLCKEADVAPSKVFPHNLRHLFARTFYQLEKDISKLADILGHTNINTTRIYMVSSGSEHIRKMEHMNLII